MDKLKVPDQRPVAVYQILAMTLADVGKTGYGDLFLEAMVAGLGTTGESDKLKLGFDRWLKARQTVRKNEYEAAEPEYDALIKGNNRNPALFYERARVLAGLSQHQAALTDLEQMMSLVNDDDSPLKAFPIFKFSQNYQFTKISLAQKT